MSTLKPDVIHPTANLSGIAGDFLLRKVNHFYDFGAVCTGANYKFVKASSDI